MLKTDEASKKIDRLNKLLDKLIKLIDEKIDEASDGTVKETNYLTIMLISRMIDRMKIAELHKMIFN